MEGRTVQFDCRPASHIITIMENPKHWKFELDTLGLGISKDFVLGKGKRCSGILVLAWRGVLAGTFFMS